MKAVLLSIKPKYCELIASGKKTVEVRKTKPKLDTPFKCYIYQTKGKEVLLDVIKEGDSIYGNTYHGKPVFIKTTEKCNGLYGVYGREQKVIGEFVCDNIIQFAVDKKADNIKLCNMEMLSCLSSIDLENYAGNKYYLYGWHISDLVIYDKPKELYNFYKPCGEYDCFICDYWVNEEQVCTQPPITRPPQSWCYVESEG